MSADSSRDATVFQALLDGSHDNIYLMDAQDRYTHVSRGGASAVGLSPEQMVGRTWRELGLPAETMEVVESHWRKVRESRQPIRHEVTFETPAGRRHFEYLMFPILDLVGMVARDITDRAVAAEQLRH